MSQPAVDVECLGRRYGRRRALHDVSLRVAPGEIVGLVGANGSGKTTLLRILGGFLRPHTGSVRVLGCTPYREQAKVMLRARFAFAPPALYPTLTAREHLHYLGAMGKKGPGRAPGPVAREVERALRRVGLEGRADDRVATYSFGMRQRLVLAQALLPTPELLVLDEPTDGLDPVAVLELRQLLREIHREVGTTIVLSSHLLVEVEQLVDRMLVLREGEAVFTGAPAQLTDGHSTLRLRPSSVDGALACLRDVPGVRTPASGELELPRGSLSLSQAHARLREAGIELHSFHEHRPSLEEALLAHLRGPERPARAGDREGAP